MNLIASELEERRNALGCSQAKFSNKYLDVGVDTYRSWIYNTPKRINNKSITAIAKCLNKTEEYVREYWNM